ncbi:MAG: PQQ-binding-like beta-propeller repeat protein [Thermomicrobiales bacterium]
MSDEHFQKETNMNTLAFDHRLSSPLIRRGLERVDSFEGASPQLPKPAEKTIQPHCLWAAELRTARSGFDPSAIWKATLSNGMVYVHTFLGDVYALDSTSGVEVWRFLSSVTICPQVVILDDMAVFADFGGLHALDARTGSSRWSRHSDNLLGVYQLGGKLYCTVGRHFVNVNEESGLARWVYTMEPGDFAGSANERDGIIYIGSAERLRLTAIDPASKIDLWQSTLPRTSPDPTWMPSEIHIGDEMIFLVTRVWRPDDLQRGDLHAINGGDGSLLWHFDGTNWFSKPSLINDLLAIERDQSVYGLAVRSGHVRWVRDLGAAISSPIQAEHDQVYVATHGKGIFALDGSSGDICWHYRLKTKTTKILLVSNGIVYAADSQRLCALDVSSGAEIWRAEEKSISSVETMDGIVYARSPKRFSAWA